MTETLHQALAGLGITSTPHDGIRRALYRGAECIGRFTASEGWELVHQLRGAGKEV